MGSSGLSRGAPSPRPLCETALWAVTCSTRLLGFPQTFVSHAIKSTLKVEDRTPPVLLKSTHTVARCART